MMKNSLKTVLVSSCTALLLCSCSGMAQYEPIEIDETVADVVEETQPEVIQLMPLPSDVYVRVPVNVLVDPDKSELGTFVNVGDKLKVTGYKYEDEEGEPVFYQVEKEGEEGWVRKWYVTENIQDTIMPQLATPNEDGEIPAENMPEEGTYEYYLTVHSLRGNPYGGGCASDADYHARDKEFTPNREMPDRVKSLYLGARMGGEHFEEFIDLARSSEINAFVINITDNLEIGYESEVMKEFCPSAYEHAINSVDTYKSKIQRLKDEGFYVIGRITTFQDDFLAADHPELTICDNNGDPRELSNGYWPTAYSRRVWQYKVDVAKEAVELFDFDEIQFDYVRFPDRTQSAEKEGNIDYRNLYNETKIQAIQRFLMYAVDQLHPLGVYVGADVFGEVAESFVGGYGQYWPAVSNVVDVISGMPYPDHYQGTEEWLPWEHPYETVKHFADEASKRQKECPTPARARNWIQGYNAYKEPHTEYYAENLGKEIQALYDAGLTDGYMIWNGANSIDQARKQADAFSLNP